MNKRIKLLLLMLMSLCVVMALCACGDKDDNEQAANPVVESDYQGVIDATGIDLPAPAGAEDVEYRYYETEPKMAEMEFELYDEDFTLRAQATDLTSIEIAESDITSITGDLLREKYGDISGIYCDWQTFATTEVKGRYAYYAISGEDGIINWLDPVTGIMYSLSMDDDDVSPQLLIKAATAAFVPMQGEA